MASGAGESTVSEKPQLEGVDSGEGLESGDAGEGRRRRRRGGRGRGREGQGADGATGISGEQAEDAHASEPQATAAQSISEPAAAATEQVTLAVPMGQGVSNVSGELLSANQGQLVLKTAEGVKIVPMGGAQVALAPDDF